MLSLYLNHKFFHIHCLFDLLKHIRGATKDLSIFSTYFGGCGKDGQNNLPCGVGGPKLIIDNVRFGGEQ